MQIHRNEIATGLLVLVTLGIVLAVLVVIGTPGVLKPMNTYRIYFDNAGGIRPGAPVLLAGREIGAVSALQSPVPMQQRPDGHTNYEVSIEVKVDRNARVYRNITVHLTQQGLMGQQVIDFVRGDEKSELAANHSDFVGERVPELSESMADHMQRLTGEGSDLAIMIKNARQFTGTLNGSDVSAVIKNTRQLSDTLKREPWRLIWKSTKEYPNEEGARPRKGAETKGKN